MSNPVGLFIFSSCFVFPVIHPFSWFVIFPDSQNFPVKRKKGPMDLFLKK